jgi:hypothetical protein
MTSQRLRDDYKESFEEQRDGWHRDPSAWPADRGFQACTLWLEYHFHSVLIDRCLQAPDHPAGALTTL